MISLTPNYCESGHFTSSNNTYRKKYFFENDRYSYTFPLKSFNNSFNCAFRWAIMLTLNCVCKHFALNAHIHNIIEQFEPVLVWCNTKFFIKDIMAVPYVWHELRSTQIHSCFRPCLCHFQTYARKIN